MFPQPLFAQHEPAKSVLTCTENSQHASRGTPPPQLSNIPSFPAGVGDVEMTLDHPTGQVMDKVSGRGFASQRNLHPRHLLSKQ